MELIIWKMAVMSFFFLFYKQPMLPILSPIKVVGQKKIKNILSIETGFTSERAVV